MKNNIINVKLILLLISVWISLIRADGVRIPFLSWEKLDVVSNIGQDLPEGRRDYAIGYYPDQDEVIIFGGRTAKNKILSDTWIFNISSRSWRKPRSQNTNTSPGPKGRYGMVYGNDQPPSNSFRNTFVITGGKGDNNEIYNDVWSFDFINECWVELVATGDIPEPRYDAVGGIDITKYSYLNQLSTVYLILSHGRNNDKYFTDTYILKLDGRSQQYDYSKLTAEWKKLDTKNAPILKDGAANGILSKDRLIIFGGCEENKGNCDTKGYYLDVAFDNSRTQVVSTSWTELPNECIRPKAYAAAARGSNEFLSGEINNDRLIIYGGVTEKKYGNDADGEVSIFDMDKQQFIGVQPSSKNKKFPKASKGAKMITTTSKSSGSDGFSIILYGGEPISKDDPWSTDIWRLDISSFAYYEEAQQKGIELTKCYEIQDVGGNEDNGNLFEETNSSESMSSFITFILAFLIAIPCLVNTSRALNCFTKKWKVIFFILGGISLVLAVVNLVISNHNSKLSIFILKIILVGLLIIFLGFPLIRPKQPGIDFNQGEINAAGVPVASVEDKGRKNKKVYKDNMSSSSSYLIETSLKEKANTAATEINVESESANTPVSPSNQLKKLTIDQNYKSVHGNKAEKHDSYISPIYINPSVKEAGEDDSDASEVEDEDEVIKKKYLSRANLWLTLLRGTGLLLLAGCIILALLTAYWDQSKLYKCKIIVFIWIILVIIIYIASIIFARVKHASSALLHTRRISFRRSDPLEPNPVSPWAITSDQMKRYSMSETSAFDDIGNVSTYSQSVRNFNQMSGAQSTAPTNAPVIGGGSSASSVSVPPLPVNSVYVNNNGLFSIQPNYQNQNQSPTSSFINQTPDPSIYKASEMTNIPASSTDYPSYKDVSMQIPTSNQASASSSVVPSPLIITNRGNNEKITTTNGSIANYSNPSPQSQAQLIPNTYNPLPSHSNNSSPLLEESPIQINTVDQESNFDLPDRSNTIENMNNKEVMMVMTVKKRKLTVVNL